MRQCLLAFLCLPNLAFAQSVNPQIYQLPDGQSIRQTPPTGGFLNLPGSVKGKTEAENPYVVLRGHTVQQGFKTTQWAEVAPVSPDGSIDQSRAGWVILPTDQAVDQQLNQYQGEISDPARTRLQQELTFYRK